MLRAPVTNACVEIAENGEVQKISSQLCVLRQPNCPTPLIQYGLHNLGNHDSNFPGDGDHYVGFIQGLNQHDLPAAYLLCFRKEDKILFQIFDLFFQGVKPLFGFKFVVLRFPLFRLGHDIITDRLQWKFH